ncbi:MAG: circularly permuted type 2 ATP-grasp protein, partial [Pseudorhodoplanes sp.]
QARTPVGAGYALENRMAMTRATNDLFAQMNLMRLAPFFADFRQGLAATCERVDPRIALLTPGRLNQSYAEQAHLARYLGFLLVEGDDLVARDGKVYVRTIAGLKRADVIWRRVDSDFIDPLELNGASRLGVPGLISAMRHGHTVVSNAPGSGFVEARALMSFMPRIAKYLLGEDLRMPNIATWWCGDREAREDVLSVYGAMTISSAFSGTVPGFGTSQQILPGSLSPQDQTRLREAIEMRGMDYVGQEVVQLSTTPVSQGSDMVARPFVLRVFAAATPDGWHVMPGAFCRVSDRPDARAISMGEGVQSADVWVLSSKPVGHESLLPATDDVPVRRILGNLPSRAADNLYWYGRYVERAEATLRVIRCMCSRNLEMDLSGDVTRTIAKLGHQLVAWGAVSKENADADTLTIVRQALSDEDAYGSGLSGVRMAGYAASVIRERISIDASKLLRALNQQLADISNLVTVADVYEAADHALQNLSALAGLEQENMNRSAGWRFLDIGLRTERAINTCRLSRFFAPEDATADDLDVMLDLIDSQITYRSRYLTGVALVPVRDMALLDPYNPRSVGYQVETAQQHLAMLPGLRDDGLLEEPQQIIARLATEIATSEARNLDVPIILAFEQRMSSFAQAIANRYFLRRPEVTVSSPMSSLA